MFNNLVLNKFKKNQFFWNAANKLGWFYPLTKFRKIPGEIMIETTNSCNLRCPVCPTHFAMRRERGLMDFNLYKSVIDEFKNRDKKPRITMIFAGEPLLHQKIDEFIAYASKNGHQTFISTNATLLSRDLARRLITAGLTSIHLCLDGFSKESHEAYRRGSDFKKVKKNVEDFISIKKELKNKNPYVVIQTLLTSFSEGETDELIKWAKTIGADSINFKTLSMGSHTTEQMKAQYEYLLPQKKEFRRKTSFINKTLCSWPLKNVVVFWNGDLGLCCVDFDQEIKLENIKEKGFLNTLFSKETAQKRKLGFQKKFALCKRCSIGNADFMGWDVKFKTQNN